MRKLALSGILIPMVLLFLAVSALWRCTPQAKQMSDEEKIAAILDSLTLKEKARLLVGTGMHFELPEGFEEMMAGMAGQGGPQAPGKPAVEGGIPLLKAPPVQRKKRHLSLPAEE